LLPLSSFPRKREIRGGWAVAVPLDPAFEPVKKLAASWSCVLRDAP
jgi:hypothetical protein